MSERHREELLDLRDLRDGTMVGLSPEVGGSLAQAGAVCLASQHHEPGVELVVTGRLSGRHPLDWESPDDQAHRTWRNEIDATENGAAGVAILMARRLLVYVVTSAGRDTVPASTTGLDGTSTETRFRTKSGSRCPVFAKGLPLMSLGACARNSTR